MTSVSGHKGTMALALFQLFSLLSLVFGQQIPTLNDISTITDSAGPWKLRLPERFVRNQMLPFIRQFRRQLNPMTEINWLTASNSAAGFAANSYANQQQLVKSTHVDLDPPEQRRYRSGPARTRSDLGGMIVREMWRKAKTHCLRCGTNGGNGGRQQCTLANPQCGYPYQLFDDQAQQIYCTATLWKLSGLIQLRVRMRCQTLPMAPSMVQSVLATNFQRNWRLMCINCDPSVYDGVGVLNGNRNNRINNNGNSGRTDYNESGWTQSYYTGNGQRGVLRVRTDQKYSRIYQISNAEGRDIARFINRVRAKIARGEATNLPVAAGMNQIKWKGALASEALKQMYTRDNDPVNIIDLDFAYLIPAGQGGQGTTMPRGDAPMDGQIGGGGGIGGNQGSRTNGLISARGTNYVDLDAHSLLLWTVRNYMEMFTNQQGISCTATTGVCKATCRKGSQRTRVVPWQRMAENPADFHCYPYELLYDRAHSIGCAIRFMTKQRTHLQAKLVCVIEHQYGRHGSVRRMMHRHNVYKVGTACSRCENSHYCDNQTKLCVAHNAQQRGYEPLGAMEIGDDGLENDYGGRYGYGAGQYGNVGRRYGMGGRNNAGPIYGRNFNNNNMMGQDCVGGYGDGCFGNAGVPGRFDGNGGSAGGYGALPDAMGMTNGGQQNGFAGGPGYPAIPLYDNANGGGGYNGL